MSEDGGQPSQPGDPAVEYKDVSDNLREYARMRFAQLTLFSVLTAGMLGLIFKSDPPPATTRMALKLVGVLVAFAFWLMEERSTTYWSHYRARAVELETQLGYRQYTHHRPRKTFFNATNAVRAIFAAAAVFWVASLVWNSRF